MRHNRLQQSIIMTISFILLLSLTMCTKEYTGGEYKTGGAKRKVKEVIVGYDQHSTKSNDRKVLSSVLLDIAEDITMQADLIEMPPIENTPTKGTVFQTVPNGSFYTFYDYPNSLIKKQDLSFIPVEKRDFEVPVDEKTNYDMIFLANLGKTSLPKVDGITNKTMKLTATYANQDNICYKMYNKTGDAARDIEKMPTSETIDLLLKPLFSQIGDIVIDKNPFGEAETVIESLTIPKGIQKQATVTITKGGIDYVKSKTNNVINLTSKFSTETIVEGGVSKEVLSLKEKNLNLIPNGNNTANFEVSLKMHLKSNYINANGYKTPPIDRLIQFEVPLESGKRYMIRISKISLPEVEINPYSILYSSYEDYDTKERPYELKERELTYDYAPLGPLDESTIKWELESYGGTITNFSLDNKGTTSNSKNPKLICKNVDAEVAVKIRLTAKDKFGRNVNDVISAYAGWLPGWRVAPHNSNSSTTIAADDIGANNNFTFNLAQARNCSFNYNGRSYHLPSVYEYSGFINDTRKGDLIALGVGSCTFGITFSGYYHYDRPPSKTGEVSRVQIGNNIDDYISYYWNEMLPENKWFDFDASSTTWKIKFDSYSLKLRKNGNDSKTCVYKYKLLKGADGYWHLYITVVYIGEKASSILAMNGNTDNVNLEKSKSYFTYSENGEKIAKARKIDFLSAINGTNAKIYSYKSSTSWGVGSWLNWAPSFQITHFTILAVFDKPIGQASYYTTAERVRLIN